MKSSETGTCSAAFNFTCWAVEMPGDRTHTIAKISKRATPISEPPSRACVFLTSIPPSVALILR
jgi:hypothetical protein